MGTYRINLDATIDAVREADPSKQNEEPPQRFLDMIKETTLKISADSLSIMIMGQRNAIKISPTASKIEGGSCDLYLVVPEVDLPKEQAPFMTIFENKSGALMLKSTNGSNDMDNYVWMKIE